MGYSNSTYQVEKFCSKLTNCLVENSGMGSLGSGDGMSQAILSKSEVVNSDYYEMGLPVFLKHEPTKEERVLVEGDDSPITLKERFCGWKEGKFILTTLSTQTEIVLSEGQEWSGRYIYEGKAICFSSKILKVLRSPSSLLILKYPPQFLTVPIRKEDRMKIRSQGKLALGKDSSKNFKMIVCDLSFGGAQIQTEDKMESGQEIYLSFTLPTGEEIHDLRAIIQSERSIGNNFNYGLSFSELCNEDIKIVKGFLS